MAPASARSATARAEGKGCSPSPSVQNAVALATALFVRAEVGHRQALLAPIITTAGSSRDPGVTLLKPRGNNPARRLRKASAALVFVYVLVFAGCDGNCPPWNQALKNQASPSDRNPKTSTVQTANELVVYLDTSGSMAGYFSRDGQTILGKALRELRYATGTFGNSDVRVLVRHVGSDIGPALPDMDLTTASQDPSLFRDGETNLAGAISSFRLRPQSSAQRSRSNPIGQGDGPSAQAEEESTPARFHILITDGVQSTRRGDALQECTAGSDQFCVRQKIGELLRQGWAGCVLGIRADFHGRVYSEVSAAQITYESKSDDPSSFRPFYLYVFSPEPAALDSLVTSLKQRLRPLIPGTESIRELNLSFPYFNGVADFEISVPKDSASLVKAKKETGEPPSRIAIHVSVDTEKSGPKPFSIHTRIPWSGHALDTGGKGELAKLLTWKLVPIYPANEVNGERYPEIKVTERPSVETDDVVLQATIGFLPGTAKPSCRVYRLEGRINFNQATPDWIKAWSTDLDTTREVGNRTFNLETALLGLWNNSIVKDQIVVEGYLRAGPWD